MPFGTAGALVEAIDTAQSVAENRIRLTFNTAPKFENIETCFDASDLSSYTYAPIDGTIDRLGDATRNVTIVAAEKVSDLIVDLITDRPMSSFFGSKYLLSVSGLISATGATPFEDQSFVILSQFKGVPSLIPERTVNNRDIANPQSLSAIYDPLPIDGQPTDDLLGKYQPDSRGDVALDEGIVSYKKRVFRRMTTVKGGFAQLPNYGVTFLQKIKQLNLPSVRDEMAFEAEDQIMQEPETVSVSVNVRVDRAAPGVVFLEIRAKTSIDREVSMVVPVGKNEV